MLLLLLLFVLAGEKGLIELTNVTADELLLTSNLGGIRGTTVFAKESLKVRPTSLPASQNFATASAPLTPPLSSLPAAHFLSHPGFHH